MKSCMEDHFLSNDLLLDLEVRELTRYVTHLGQFQEDTENRGKDYVWSSSRGSTSGKAWKSGAHLHLVGESTPGSIARVEVAISSDLGHSYSCKCPGNR
jgi:hypothetical protein